MGILLLIVAKHVLHILDDMFCKVTLSVTYNIYWIFELKPTQRTGNLKASEDHGMSYIF